MIIKHRTKSLFLTALEILDSRIKFSESEKQYFLSVEKGYQGELMNDLWVEKLNEEVLVLHNLLFEINNSQFQIDTLMITQDKIYVFDVKNYEGDYHYKNDGFYNSSGKETKNLLHQLKRCETLLRQLLQTLGFNYPISSYLIFINPEFYLYLVPADLPIVYPTQLKRFYTHLNSKPSKLNERHKKLAEKLLSLNIQESPYSKIPSYEYESLKKGNCCFSCRSLSTSLVKKKMILCQECGCIEKLEAAVMRSVEEFRVLFPERKVTCNGIFEWCGGIGSRKMIRRILIKNLKLVQIGRHSYYK